MVDVWTISCGPVITSDAEAWHKRDADAASSSRVQVVYLKSTPASGSLVGVWWHIHAVDNSFLSCKQAAWG